MGDSREQENSQGAQEGQMCCGLKGLGAAKGQQVTLKRIPEEQVQLQDFGTGLSGQTNASLVPVSLSTFAVCCMDGIFSGSPGKVKHSPQLSVPLAGWMKSFLEAQGR